ncbi:MAG: glycosyltransferase [Candidatus Thiodiazotropha lotti]|nr:glycosyltransferase [Candidatus Thiodiazotropha lotti]
MKSKNIAVVACAKSTFAGSATIKLRFLNLLSCIEFDCHYVSSGIPPESDQHPNSRIIFHTPSPKELGVKSDGADVIIGDLFTETIISVALGESRRGKMPLIWGSALFPYGRACLNAKIELIRRGVESRLIIFPVGADVWEIGTNLPLSVKAMLDHPAVDLVSTYSTKFAKEIADTFKVENIVNALPPYVDANRFKTISDQSRLSLRKDMGLSDEDIVFVCHSNMRPIKRLDATIALFEYIREAIRERCVLLLVGPLSDTINLPKDVRCLGYQKDVTPFLKMSDFFINTSLHDSFNTALIEAVACGTIPITSSAPAVTECMERYDCGYIFYMSPKLGKVKEVCDAPLDNLNIPYESASCFVCKCIQNRAYRQKLKFNGAKMIIENFSKDVCEKNLSEMIGFVTRSRGS